MSDIYRCKNEKIKEIKAHEGQVVEMHAWKWRNVKNNWTLDWGLSFLFIHYRVYERQQLLGEPANTYVEAHTIQIF